MSCDGRRNTCRRAELSTADIQVIEIEVAAVPDTVKVGDSKNSDGPVLPFPAERRERSSPAPGADDHHAPLPPRPSGRVTIARAGGRSGDVVVSAGFSR